MKIGGLKIDRYLEEILGFRLTLSTKRSGNQVMNYDFLKKLDFKLSFNQWFEWINLQT